MRPMRIRPHDDYTPQERGRLRRLARMEVPELPTLGPAVTGDPKPFVAPVTRPSEWAPAETRAVALMMQQCCTELQIGPPSTTLMIRLYPAQAGHLVAEGLAEEVGVRRIAGHAAGTADAERIRIRIDRTPEAVARTTAHELRHVARPPASFEDLEAAEADARSYAEDAMRRLWPPVKEDLPERAAPESVPSTTYQTR
jgi:hypothetical protein